MGGHPLLLTRPCAVAAVLAVVLSVVLVLVEEVPTVDVAMVAVDVEAS